MATEKQRMALEKMVENGGIASKAMRDVGYSEQTAKSPHKLTESKGFQEICKEYGLTEGLIVKSLVEDITSKPQNRVGELGLATKIMGMQIDKSENTNTVKIIEASKEGIEKYGLNSTTS